MMISNYDYQKAAEQYRAMDHASLSALILQKMHEAAEHSRAGRQRELRISEREHSAAQRRLAIDFGEVRGWKLTDRQFDLMTLSRGKQHSGARDYSGRHQPGHHHSSFDHPYFYKRDRKAAAIVAHLYGWPSDTCRAECAEIADRYGLKIETPDFPSWWYPGGTTLVVYTGPAA
jgi:hypothetical protein